MVFRRPISTIQREIDTLTALPRASGRECKILLDEIILGYFGSDLNLLRFGHMRRFTFDNDLDSAVQCVPDDGTTNENYILLKQLMEDLNRRLETAFIVAENDCKNL